MVDGEGDPNNSEQFQKAINALYSVAYTLKFMRKKRQEEPDFSIMPLEGLWSVDDPKNFSLNDKSSWKWTLMIAVPDFITEKLFKEALEEAKKKKGLPAFGNLRFDRFEEGLCVQIIHIGPYTEESSTVFRSDSNESKLL